MKVLEVIDSLQIGGAETVVRDLAVGLSKRGVDVSIYELRHVESHLAQELSSFGVPLLSAEEGSVYSPLQIVKLLTLLRCSNYDLVHVHLFPAQLWTAIAAFLRGLDVPLITTEHNTYNRRRRALLRSLDSWMYRRYEAVVAVSDAAAEAIVRFIPHVGNRLHVIPNGVDLARLESAPGYDRRMLIGTEAPLVVMVSRFDPQKDHVTVIKALSRLPGVHAVFVGDGPLRERTERLAESLSVSDRAHFLGRRSDVPSLLKSADVFVQSSVWEGFGLATLEAMACGLPVVASRVAGLADVVGDVGLLFRAGDADDLREQLSILLTTPALRAELGQRAKERAKRFGIPNMVGAYYELYQLLAG